MLQSDRGQENDIICPSVEKSKYNVVIKVAVMRFSNCMIFFYSSSIAEQMRVLYCVAIFLSCAHDII